MDRRRLLSHPTLAAAVLVLLLNDQWGKAAWPGAVTGKLSDLAGVYVVAVVLGAVVGRAAPALALTGVGFALLKLDADVARLAAPLLGGVTRPDATDLVALVVLWPAARLLAGRARVARSTVRDVLVVVLGLCTVSTTTATSCEQFAGVIGFGTDANGTLWAELAEGSTRAWASSPDAGRTWRLVAPGDPAPVLTARSADTACVAPERCYRVVNSDIVEARDHSLDWTVAFAFTAEQHAAMKGRAGGGCSADAKAFESVFVVERDGPPLVLVAAGRQGLLRRDGDGAWERRAVLDYRPISDAPVSRAGRLAPLAPVVLLLLSPLVGLSAKRGRRLWTGVGAFCAAVGALLLVVLVNIVGGRYSPAMYALAVVTGVCLVVAVGLGRWPWRPRATPMAPSPPWPPPPPPRA